MTSKKDMVESAKCWMKIFKANSEGIATKWYSYDSEDYSHNGCKNEKDHGIELNIEFPNKKGFLASTRKLILNKFLKEKIGIDCTKQSLDEIEDISFKIKDICYNTSDLNATYFDLSKININSNDMYFVPYNEILPYVLAVVPDFLGNEPTKNEISASSFEAKPAILTKSNETCWVVIARPNNKFVFIEIEKNDSFFIYYSYRALTILKKTCPTVFNIVVQEIFSHEFYNSTDRLNSFDSLPGAWGYYALSDLIAIISDDPNEQYITISLAESLMVPEIHKPSDNDSCFRCSKTLIENEKINLGGILTSRITNESISSGMSSVTFCASCLSQNFLGDVKEEITHQVFQSNLKELMEPDGRLKEGVTMGQFAEAANKAVIRALELLSTGQKLNVGELAKTLNGENPELALKLTQEITKKFEEATILSAKNLEFKLLAEKETNRISQEVTNLQSDKVLLLNTIDDLTRQLIAKNNSEAQLVSNSSILAGQKLELEKQKSQLERDKIVVEKARSEWEAVAKLNEKTSLENSNKIKELQKLLPPPVVIIKCTKCGGQAPFNQPNNDDETFTCLACAN